jgi:hypothetical protein
VNKVSHAKSLFQVIQAFLPWLDYRLSVGDDVRFGHFVIPAKAGIQKGEPGFPPSRE